MVLENPGVIMCRATLGNFIVLSLTAAMLCSAHSGAHSGHGQSSGDVDNRFHDTAVVQDAEHVKEHLQEQVNVDVSNMTDEELEFHYFKLHDTDNDTRLDGLEILQALAHHGQDDEFVPPLTDEQLAGKTPEQVKTLEQERKNKIMDFFTGFIDRILTEDDLNNDGYLTYVEFVLSRRRATKEEEKRNKSEKDEI